MQIQNLPIKVVYMSVQEAPFEAVCVLLLQTEAERESMVEQESPTKLFTA